MAYFKPWSWTNGMSWAKMSLDRFPDPLPMSIRSQAGNLSNCHHNAISCPCVWQPQGQVRTFPNPLYEVDFHVGCRIWLETIHQGPKLKVILFDGDGGEYINMYNCSWRWCTIGGGEHTRDKTNVGNNKLCGSPMLCCSNVSEWLIIPHEGAEYNEKRKMTEEKKTWI